MKTSVSILIFGLFFNLIFGQINPVQNLSWEQSYNEGNNDFSLRWEEPEEPHDELMGYNIYREDELFRFQTETEINCAVEWGEYDCDFLYYNYEGFVGAVAAVYEGGTESEYVYFETYGPAIGVTDVEAPKMLVYPNPVHDILYFESRAFKIYLLDINGRIIKSFPEADSVSFKELVPGIYMIRYSDSTGKLYFKKIIKN